MNALVKIFTGGSKNDSTERKIINNSISLFKRTGTVLIRILNAEIIDKYMPQ